MADGHNISNVTKRLFADHGCHSLLWPKATALEKSQAVYDAKAATPRHSLLNLLNNVYNAFINVDPLTTSELDGFDSE